MNDADAEVKPTLSEITALEMADREYDGGPAMEVDRVTLALVYATIALATEVRALREVLVVEVRPLLHTLCQHSNREDLTALRRAEGAVFAAEFKRGIEQLGGAK